MHRSFLFRLAVTIGLPLLVFVAGEWIHLPGLPAEVVEDMRGPHTDLGIFALGVTPVINAYILVEIAAFLVPRWRRLRHGHPAGRAKLETAARLLAIAVAAVQAYGVAVALRGLTLMKEPLLDVVPEPPAMFVPLAMMALVGGVCIQFVVASLLSRWGFLNGIVTLTCASALESIAGLVGEARAVHYEARELAFSAVAFLVSLVATWVILRGAGMLPEQPRTSGDEGTPYRDRDARQLAIHPYIPLPSSSYQAHATTLSLLMLPATLMNWGLPTQSILFALQGKLYLLVALLLTAIVAVAFSWVMHRPAEMADLAVGLGAKGGPELRREARVAWRRALVPSLVYFAAVLVAQSTGPIGAVSLGIVALPMLMDFVHGARIHGLGLVPVWQERRASAVPVIRAALGARGIAVETQGMHVLSFWQAFVPYAPVRLLVRRDDAERARAILAHLFLGEEAPQRTAEDTEAAPLLRSEVPWSASRRTAILAGCAVAAGVAFASSPLHIDEEAPVRRAEIEVVRVDDAFDPFESMRDEDLPKGQGIDIRVEDLGRTRVHFARISLVGGETATALEERARRWLAAIPLPSDTRLALMPLSEFDPASGKETIVAMRTHVLTGAPVLTTNDIVLAAASVEQSSLQPYVGITLSEEGAKRFADATQEWKGHRIAILIDGTIDSAPLVKSAILGGHLSITMGAGDPEAKLEQAKGLARRLAR